MRRALALVLLAACGYRPMNAPAEERFAVVLASSQVADGAAADEVVAGVREELARRGAYASGEGYPRCEIEVLRADETSDGIQAVLGPDGRRLPAARATQVALVTRAWVVRAKDGPRERDTGDVRAALAVGAANEARAATFLSLDALRAAGRRAGRQMGLRLLGLPAANDE